MGAGIGRELREAPSVAEASGVGPAEGVQGALGQVVEVLQHFLVQVGPDGAEHLAPPPEQAVLRQEGERDLYLRHRQAQCLPDRPGGGGFVEVVVEVADDRLEDAQGANVGVGLAIGPADAAGQAFQLDAEGHGAFGHGGALPSQALAANLPRSVFTKRAALPLVLISRRMAL